MAALTNLSDLINRATGGNSGTPETVFFYKAARVAGAAPTALIAGRPASLWRYDGQPSGGAVPDTPAVCTNATAGALPFTNPGGGREKFMIQAWATGLVGGTLILYDRLLHSGNLVGNVNTLQVVGGQISRNTGGEGNMAWAEIYTAVGSTATTITMTYTDQGGTPTRVSTPVVFGGTGFNTASRAIFMPLQSGDTGIQEVISVQLAASTATAGAFGVTIGKPLAYLGVGAAGAPGWRDFVTGMPGLPQIPANACLALLWIPVAVTAPEITGGYSFVEK
jgi:hypothetical protein